LCSRPLSDANLTGGFLLAIANAIYSNIINTHPQAFCANNSIGIIQ
jgi:hypothetical protein